MISIIIPFNKMKYLNTSLENLKQIKNKRFEVVLVDDFSENDSLNIVNQYKSFFNIKYCHTEERTIGVGNARNKGIKMASEKYIMFLDVDDTIESSLIGKLEETVLKEKDLDLIKYCMKIINKDKKTYFTNNVSFDTTSGQEGFNKLCFKDKYLDSPCLYLIKKELLMQNKIEFEKNVYHEDFGTIPQIILCAKKFKSLDCFGYNYNQTQNSIIRQNNYANGLKKIEDKIFLYQKTLKKAKDFNLKFEVRNNLSKFYINSIISSIENLEKSDRLLFEKKLKKEKILDNYIPKNFKQTIKKIFLINNMELYFKLKEYL